MQIENYDSQALNALHISFRRKRKMTSEIHVVSKNVRVFACFNRQQCSIRSTSKRNMQVETKRHVITTC